MKQLVLVAVVAIVVAIVVVLGRGDSRPSPNDAHTKAAQPEIDSAGGVGPARKADAVGDPTPTVADPSERTLIESPPPFAVTHDATNLRVVEAATGRAVPKAKVWWLDRQRFREAHAKAAPELMRDRDPLPVLRSGAEGRFADETGSLAIPSEMLARGTIIVAVDREDENGGSALVGWMTVESAPTSDEPMVLMLEPRSEVRVRVVDADGAPCADLPLRMLLPRGETNRSLWFGTTDARGDAVIRQVRQRARVAAGNEFAPGLVGKVFVDAMFDPAAYLDVSIDALPAERLELRLPAHGRVTVELERDAGVVSADANAMLSLRAPSPGREIVTPAASVLLHDGRGTFALVGLGLALNVSIRTEGETKERSVAFAGPMVPGQEVVVVVPAEHDAHVVVARLLDAERKPRGKVRLSLRKSISGPRGSMSAGETLRTDGEGRVRIPIDDDFGPDAKRVLEFVDDANGRDARATLPRPLPDGLVDLGDLVLDEPPLVVAGVVVGPTGDPISGASIQAEPLHNVRARSAGDGSFVLRSRDTADAIRLRTTASGYRENVSEPVVLGARGFVIRLERAAIVAGSVLLDDLGTHIDLRVELTDSAAATGVASEEHVDAQGFQFDDVVFPTCDVALFLAGRKDPIDARRGVRTEPGRRVELEPFDLRGRLRAFSFTVIDETGAAIDDARALIANDVGKVGSPLFEGILFEGATGRIVTDRPSVDVFVFADNRCGKLVTALRDGERVTLDQKPRLRVRLGDGLTIPEGLRVRVGLQIDDKAWPSDARYVMRSAQGSRSVSGARPWDTELELTLDAQGAGELIVPATGSYGMRWSLLGPPAPNARQLTLRTAAPATIELPVGRATVDCVLTFEQSAVDDLARQMPR